jgi:hypothetical protein
MSLYHFEHIAKLGSSEKISVVTVGNPSTPRCDCCIRPALCNGSQSSFKVGTACRATGISVRSLNLSNGESAVDVLTRDFESSVSFPQITSSTPDTKTSINIQHLSTGISSDVEVIARMDNRGFKSLRTRLSPRPAYMTCVRTQMALSARMAFRLWDRYVHLNHQLTTQSIRRLFP